MPQPVRVEAHETSPLPDTHENMARLVVMSVRTDYQSSCRRLCRQEHFIPVELQNTLPQSKQIVGPRVCNSIRANILSSQECAIGKNAPPKSKHFCHPKSVPRHLPKR